MSLDIHEIAEAFCSHRFIETYPYMADEIKWNILGMEELTGRAAVIDRCEQLAKFLETVTKRMLTLKTIQAGSVVIVEGAAQFQDPENQVSSVASCDVFQFPDGRLVELSSYVVDLNKPSFRVNQKGEAS